MLLMIFLFIFSTASSPIIIPLDSDEEFFDEYEYVDPYEGEGPFSSTPPPSCDHSKEHKICVPPAWGEEIPGSVVRCRCLLCHQEDMHHAIRCLQCGNALGCCLCIWGYMRSRYNSGCPLCRAGDPCGEDPLGSEQQRILTAPLDRPSLVVIRGRGGRRRGRRGRGRAMGSTLLCGTGRGAGRGRTPQEEEERRREDSGRGGRRGGRGRGTTVEQEEEEKKE